MKIEEGQTAPDFTLLDQTNGIYELYDFRRRPVLLFFYESDNDEKDREMLLTLNDNLEFFRVMGIKILAVSTDTVAQHKEFAERHRINFTILSDADRRVMNMFEAVETEEKGPKKTTKTKHRAIFMVPRCKIVKILDNIGGKRFFIEAGGTFAKILPRKPL